MKSFEQERTNRNYSSDNQMASALADIRHTSSAISVLNFKLVAPPQKLATQFFAPKNGGSIFGYSARPRAWVFWSFGADEGEIAPFHLCFKL
jgi:hypothetical protein